MKVNRREFFGKTIKGAAVLALPGVLGTFLESCTKNSNPVNPSNLTNLQSVQGNLQNGIINLKIDSSSPLNKTGSAVLLGFQSGSLLVDRPSSNNFNVLSSICTHQGCTITEYDPGSQNFVCPCHGSVFSSSGQVVNGPAGSALPKYQNQFVNGVLTIKV